MPENFLYYGDNLEILQRYIADESVDLIYLDPPFIGNAPAALKIADVAFPVNVGLHVPEVISPFAGIVAGQIFTHALSLLKGFNPDQPRNLQKVTITM